MISAVMLSMISNNPLAARMTAGGRKKSQAPCEIKTWILVTVTTATAAAVFTTSATAHPDLPSEDGSARYALRSTSEYCSIDFAMQFVNAEVSVKACASSTALWMVFPPASGGRVVVPSMGVLFR